MTSMLGVELRVTLELKVKMNTIPTRTTSDGADAIFIWVSFFNKI